MSAASAIAFLDKLEADEAFSAKLEAMKDDPSAVRAALTEAGFDATPEEVKMAFVARYGSELSADQLEALAGGIDGASLGIGIGVGVAAGLGIVAAVGAAAAAI